MIYYPESIKKKNYLLKNEEKSKLGKVKDGFGILKLDLTVVVGLILVTVVVVGLLKNEPKLLLHAGLNNASNPEQVGGDGFS